MLLGDGCLSLSGGKNAFLRIQHTQTQKDYLYYKVNLLKGLCNFTIYKINPSGKKNPNTQYAFKSHRNPLYTKTRQIIYPGGKKTVNLDWLSWLNEHGLALWYMDDGCLIKSYRINKSGNRIIYRREIFLNTCSFTLEEHKLLKQFIKERFGVEFQIKLTSKKSGYYRLRAGAVEANKFIEIIKPWIVPCMKYKIKMEYQNNT
jgi:LAGLIDADG DNA endonuclease family